MSLEIQEPITDLEVYLMKINKSYNRDSQISDEREKSVDYLDCSTNLLDSQKIISYKSTIMEYAPFLFLTVISTVDDFSRSCLISNLGPDALAAGVWIDAVEQFAAGMNDHISSIINLIGKAQNEEDACGILRASYVMTLISSILTILSLSFVNNVMDIANQDNAVTAVVSDFAQVYKWGFFTIMLCIATRDFIISSTNIVKQINFFNTNILLPTLAVPIIFEVINLIFDRLIGSLLINFIQIKGIAVASFSSAAITLILYVAFLIKSPDYSKFCFFRADDISKLWQSMKLIFKYASTSLEILLKCIIGVLIAKFILKLNTDNLAAYHIVVKYMLIPNIFTATFARSVKLIVSQLYGRNEFPQAYQFVQKTMRFNLLITCLCVIAFVTIPKQLSSLFINDPNDPKNVVLINHCGSMFKIMSANLTFSSLDIITTNALRGLEHSDVNCTVLIRIFPLVIGCISAFLFNWGMEGILIAQAIGSAVSLAGNYYRWYKRTNEIIGSNSHYQHKNTVEVELTSYRSHNGAKYSDYGSMESRDKSHFFKGAQICTKNVSGIIIDIDSKLSSVVLN